MFQFPFAKEIFILFMVIGGGFFGHRIGEVLKKKAIEKNPEKAKRITIEQRDERNRAILNAAKSKAFDTITWIIGLTILVLGLLGYLDKVRLGVLIFIFILGQSIMLYQLYKTQR